jgi:hypothetical protein
MEDWAEENAEESAAELSSDGKVGDGKMNGLHPEFITDHKLMQGEQDNSGATGDGGDGGDGGQDQGQKGGSGYGIGDANEMGTGRMLSSDIDIDTDQLINQLGDAALEEENLTEQTELKAEEELAAEMADENGFGDFDHFGGEDSKSDSLFEHRFESTTVESDANQQEQEQAESQDQEEAEQASGDSNEQSSFIPDEDLFDKLVDKVAIKASDLDSSEGVKLTLGEEFKGIEVQLNRNPENNSVQLDFKATDSHGARTLTQYGAFITENLAQALSSKIEAKEIAVTTTADESLGWANHIFRVQQRTMY